MNVIVYRLKHLTDENPPENEDVPVNDDEYIHHEIKEFLQRKEFWSNGFYFSKTAKTSEEHIVKIIKELFEEIPWLIDAIEEIKMLSITHEKDLLKVL